MTIHTGELAEQFCILTELAKELGLDRNTVLYRSARLGMKTFQFQFDRRVYLSQEDAQILRTLEQEKAERLHPAGAEKTGANAKARPHTGGKTEHRAQ